MYDVYENGCCDTTLHLSWKSMESLAIVYGDTNMTIMTIKGT